MNELHLESLLQWMEEAPVGLFAATCTSLTEISIEDELKVELLFEPVDNSEGETGY